MSQKTIWKFDLPFDLPTENRFTIDMPKNADILHIEMQHHRPRLWALVDRTADKEARSFSIVGTGKPADHVRRESYIGTFQIVKRVYQHQQHKTLIEVWHLFEIIN